MRENWRKYMASAVIATLSMGNAVAQDEMSKDEAVACQAMLCLAAVRMVPECAGPLRQYYSIRHLSISRTSRKRLAFLKRCPTNDNGQLATRINLQHGHKKLEFALDADTRKRY